MNIPRRSLALLVAVLSALLGSLAASAGTTYAHAELIASSPANQSVLDASPTEIVLQFTENIDPVSPAIRLVDATGAGIETADVDQSGGGDTMRVALTDVLADGTYVVAWQAVSTDSHRIRGAFTFSVGEATTTSPGLVDGLFDEGSSGPAESLLLGVGRSLSYAGIGVFFGVLAMAAVVAPSSIGSRRVGALLAVAVAVGFVGTLLMIVGQSQLLTGSIWSWGDVADTSSGRWWFTRLACVALLGVLVPFRAKAATVGGRVLVVAMAIGTFAVVAAGGHAIAGDDVVVGLVATVVHLAAMSIWVGGLVLVFAGVPRTEFWHAVLRLSPWALGAVVALAVSGSVNGWRQLGSISGLTDSAYGRWLVVKVLLVLLVVAVAGVNRWFLSQRDRTGADLVWRTVGVELAGIALVLMATAGLVNASPPQAPAQNVSASAVVGDRVVQVELEPAVTGGTEMHVYVTSPSGGLDQPDEITVTAALPSADLGPLELAVVPAGPNHVIGANADLPVAGLWTFEVTARYGEFDQVVFRVALPVSDG